MTSMTTTATSGADTFLADAGHRYALTAYRAYRAIERPTAAASKVRDLIAISIADLAISHEEAGAFLTGAYTTACRVADAVRARGGRDTDVEFGDLSRSQQHWSLGRVAA